MKSRTDTFQDRAGRAAEAKAKALDAFRSKAPVDDETLAERRAARLAREAADAEKRAAKKAAVEAAREAKAPKPRRKRPRRRRSWRMHQRR